MQNWQLAAIVAAVIVVAACIGWLIYNQRRSRQLRDHFGSEYERAVTELGDRRRAETELARREQHVRSLNIRPLSLSDRQNFSGQWMRCQTLFVDDPAGAVNEADRLLTDVIRMRGYAADDPRNLMADISAAYPNRANDYRMAAEVLARHRDGEASTEDLRQAFVHYRALFDEILGGQDEELKRVS
jgi:hypothetical protein